MAASLHDMPGIDRYRPQPGGILHPAQELDAIGPPPVANIHLMQVARPQGGARRVSRGP